MKGVEAEKKQKREARGRENTLAVIIHAMLLMLQNIAVSRPEPGETHHEGKSTLLVLRVSRAACPYPVSTCLCSLLAVLTSFLFM